MTPLQYSAIDFLVALLSDWSNMIYFDQHAQLDMLYIESCLCAGMRNLNSPVTDGSGDLP